MNKQTAFFIILTLTSVIVGNAQIMSSYVEPTGVYSQVDTEKQSQSLLILKSTNAALKSKLIDAVIAKPNDYTPPVLYAMAQELFLRDDKDNAVYWYNLAHLRALYDANLCLDNSAKEEVARLNKEYGTEITLYALQDITKLEQTVQKVIDFVRTNSENYDERWISLHGKLAQKKSGQENTTENRDLCLPKSEWGAVKKRTIDEFRAEFLENVLPQKK